jgi:hypothetical protein
LARTRYYDNLRLLLALLHLSGNYRAYVPEGA